MSGENNPMFEKNALDYMSEEAIKERSRKISIAMSGKNNPNHKKHIRLMVESWS
jgi:hypothetical protein